MTFSAEFPPQMTVVIPTLGKSPHLRGLLERLQRQAVSIPVEILVVANLPSQALRETVVSFGISGQIEFEYLETGRIGVSLARNKGLDRSRGQVVLFLDDDAILDNDRFLEMHFELHRHNPHATALGGPYRLSPQANSWDLAYHNVAHEWLDKQRKNFSENETHHLLGGNISFKRDHLAQNSWRFDEEITFGGAESGLCQRISTSGRTLLYFEDLEIGHSPGMSLFLYCRKAFLQGAGAQWRQQNLPEPTAKFLNEFIPEHFVQKSYDETIRRRLYQLCFSFGFTEAPFSKRKPEIRKSVETPKLSYFGLMYFGIRRLTLRKKLQRLFRSMYAALRSAWLNGQIETAKRD